MSLHAFSSRTPVFIYTLVVCALSTQASEQDLFELSLEQLMGISVSSTASLNIEPITQAPAPITVISAQMIERSGAKNIKDLLLRYVPGMHYIQDAGEQVIAMRGVYASSQQKILFLLNGVRLNQRVFAAQDPDYSLSLNKVERIEVVRGPSSSIYGNSALTAVVNMITKTGKNNEGFSAAFSVGSYGEQKLNMEYGQVFSSGRGDLYLWAQQYQADGEEVTLDSSENWSVSDRGEGRFYIDRFKDTPSYDVGGWIQYGDIQFLFTEGASKYSKPFNSFGDFEGQTYELDDYRKINGLQAGGTEFYHRHYALSHLFKGDDYQIEGRVYFDQSGFFGLGVSDPHLTGPDSNRLVEFSISDEDWGAQAHINKKLQNTFGESDLILGLQYEMVNANRGRIVVYSGENQQAIYFSDSDTDPMMLEGDEEQRSIFAQYKQHLPHKWVVNIGTRYDQKVRRNGEKSIEAFSPRFSVSHDVNEYWSIKGSYAESFVDAPYWYRYNNLSTFQGAQGLEPEYLAGYQITFTFRNGQAISNTLNLFYNELSNFIVFRPEASAQKVFNSGVMTNYGVENEFLYSAKQYSVRFNLTYLGVLDHENITVIDGKIRDVPEYWANLIYDRSLSENMSAQLHVNYLGEQQSPIGNTAYINGVSVADANNKVSARAITNLNLLAKDVWVSDLNLALRVSNIFDEKHFQGGTVQHPYQQPGRWWAVTTSYTF